MPGEVGIRECLAWTPDSGGDDGLGSWTQPISHLRAKLRLFLFGGRFSLQRSHLAHRELRSHTIGQRVRLQGVVVLSAVFCRHTHCNPLKRCFLLPPSPFRHAQGGGA